MSPDEDNISLADNFDKLKDLAITKIKKLVAKSTTTPPQIDEPIDEGDSKPEE